MADKITIPIQDILTEIRTAIKELSSSVQKVSSQIIGFKFKQEEDHEWIEALRKRYHKIDGAVMLLGTGQENINKTLDKYKEDIGDFKYKDFKDLKDDIITRRKAPLKWFGANWLKIPVMLSMLGGLGVGIGGVAEYFYSKPSPQQEKLLKKQEQIILNMQNTIDRTNS